MLTVAFFWENGWLDPKIEMAIFRQLKGAYGIDRIVAVPELLPNRTNVDCFKNMNKALETCEGKKVFLVPPGRTREGAFIGDYKFEKDCTFVLGKAGENLLRFVKPGDDILTVPTPRPVDLFSVSIIGNILYEYRQQNPFK